MHNLIHWVTGSVQLDWIEQILQLRKSIWPDYQRLDSDTVLKLYQEYPEYQWLAYYKKDVVGIINSLPLTFDGALNTLPDGGLNWVLSFLKPNFVAAKERYTAAVSATLNPAYQNLGLSKHLLMRLKESAKEAQSRALLVPARPSRKERYPLIAMDKYLKWKRADNRMFDPWLRTHEKLGAKISHTCNQSRSIKARVERWEHWLGMPLPQTGHYLIKGGLNPLFIDKEEGLGHYVEPNVWVIYPLNDGIVL